MEDEAGRKSFPSQHSSVDLHLEIEFKNWLQCSPNHIAFILLLICRLKCSILTTTVPSSFLNSNELHLWFASCEELPICGTLCYKLKTMSLSCNKKNCCWWFVSWFSAANSQAATSHAADSLCRSRFLYYKLWKIFYFIMKQVLLIKHTYTDGASQCLVDSSIGWNLAPRF